MPVAWCYMHFAEHPYRNMAIDEWLFGRGMSRPGMIAIRLYSWSPGGITFGCNQRVEKAIKAELLGGTPVIRRVTGGRALYHDHSELTYAVVVNQEGLADSPLRGTLRQTSAAIAEALTVFLGRLGLQSQYLRHTEQPDRRPDYFHTAPCFDSVARHEIVVAQQKVVASAQRRIGSTMLQHGSIKIAGVAYHPALDGEASASHRRMSSDPIQSQQFHDLGRVFFETLGQCFGVACERAELTAEDLCEVEARTSEVEKNPTALRDIIKRIASVDSH